MSCEKNIEHRLTNIEKILFGSIDLPFMSLHPDAKLPEKSGPFEACYDLFCVYDENGEGWELDYYAPGWVFRLEPYQSYTFSLGIASAIPTGYAVYLWDRSGLAVKHNIHRLAGVIDSTYRGEWKACLINLSDQPYYITSGDKIIQAQLTRVFPAKPFWVNKLPDSYRGEDGFGSTGK